jgi:hypothetical protein
MAAETVALAALAVVLAVVAVVAEPAATQQRAATVVPAQASHSLRLVPAVAAAVAADAELMIPLVLVEE